LYPPLRHIVKAINTWITQEHTEENATARVMAQIRAAGCVVAEATKYMNETLWGNAIVILNGVAK